MKNHTEHNFFKNIKIEELNLENFQIKLDESSPDLVGVFFYQGKK